MHAMARITITAIAYVQILRDSQAHLVECNSIKFMHFVPSKRILSNAASLDLCLFRWSVPRPPHVYCIRSCERERSRFQIHSKLRAIGTSNQELQIYK